MSYVNSTRYTKLKNNCVLIVKNKRAYLRSNRFIENGEEILACYYFKN